MTTTMTVAEQIAALQAENAALKAKAAAKAISRGLSFKVSEKGAVSVYGMGRFPVTLYGEQWSRLFAHATELQDFIIANAGSLKLKGEAAA